MSSPGRDDAKAAPAGAKGVEPGPGTVRAMTSFVESCVGTVVGSAGAAERHARHRPRAKRLLRVLAGKKNVLVTTHQYPDPDALASSLAIKRLLEAKLTGAKITVAVKNMTSGGLNAAFVQHAQLELAPWDDGTLDAYDAIILLDVQPTFRFSPLPPGVHPTVVIDHHRTRDKKLECLFCDIRTEVGATSSIIFSYFMELEVPIDRALAATLLFAIETDLAGAAGTPGELDNVALSGLTLLADTRRLYKMRYVDLPQAFYIAHASALASAVFYDHAMVAHLDATVSPETPAVIADFLLRFDQVRTVLVTAVSATALVLSLRTSDPKFPAAELVRRLLRQLGERGGHRTKAGGFVPLNVNSPAEIDKARRTLRRRLLRALKIQTSHGKRLIPKAD